jgi:tetratricopeptide (TPR) repeat protein
MVEIATAFVDAHSLIGRGDLSRAEPLVAKVVRDDPDSLAAHQIRGRYLLALGESDPEYLPGALEELQAALAVAPESAFELRFVAEAYFALDDWPVGLQYFARAAAAGPMISDLQRDYRSVFGDATERARELAAAGESGRALKLLDAVAALEPEDAAVARRAEDLRREIQRD